MLAAVVRRAGDRWLVAFIKPTTGRTAPGDTRNIGGFGFIPSRHGHEAMVSHLFALVRNSNLGMGHRTRLSSVGSKAHASETAPLSRCCSAGRSDQPPPSIATPSPSRAISLKCRSIAARTCMAVDRQAHAAQRFQLAAEGAGAAGVVVARPGTPLLLDDKPLQWLSDNYTSDIDHTGSLSEAIVTLPKELPRGDGLPSTLQYGGTITPGATRLTRVGTPEDVAARSEWDEISEPFTAVRGLGLRDVVSGGDGGREHERRQCRV